MCSSRASVLGSQIEHLSHGTIAAWTGEYFLCWLREVSDLNDLLQAEQSAMMDRVVAGWLKVLK